MTETEKTKSISMSTFESKDLKESFCFQELLISFVLQVSIFSAVPSFLGLGDGYTTFFYIFIWAIVLAILVRIRQTFASNFYPLLPLALLALSLPTFILHSHETRLSVLQFLSFVILPFLLFTHPLNAEKLLKYTIRLSLVHLTYLNVIFDTAETGSLNMGLAYGLLVSILACLVLVKYYRNALHFIDCLAIAVNLYYMANVILFGNRGQLVALVVIVVLLFIGRFSKHTELSKRRVFRTAVVLIVAAILLLNIQSIIPHVDMLLKSAGIEINGLSRSIMLANTGIGADAYRFEQYEAAIKGFFQSPVMGNGMCTFVYVNRGGQLIEYPHNLFAQMLYDGGLIFFIVITSVLIIGTFFVFRFASKSEYAIFVLLFSNAIPHFMFSSDIFLQPDLWMLLAFFWYFIHKKQGVPSSSRSSLPVSNKTQLCFQRESISHTRGDQL